jgi:hypothetical protein
VHVWLIVVCPELETNKYRIASISVERERRSGALLKREVVPSVG